MDIRRTVRRALSATNAILKQFEYRITVRTFTVDDIAWCIHLTREQLAERQLPWEVSGEALTDREAFNFSFELPDAVNKPAAACLSRFCPSSHQLPAILNIEMVQNFHLQDSILDGNTLKFVLIAATFFMADTHCSGLRLISPINERVANYYVREHGFKDITGDNLILYRQASELFRWLQLILARGCE